MAKKSGLVALVKAMERDAAARERQKRIAQSVQLREQRRLETLNNREQKKNARQESLDEHERQSEEARISNEMFDGLHKAVLDILEWSKSESDKNPEFISKMFTEPIFESQYSEPVAPFRLDNHMVIKMIGARPEVIDPPKFFSGIGHKAQKYEFQLKAREQWDKKFQELESLANSHATEVETRKRLLQEDVDRHEKQIEDIRVFKKRLSEEVSENFRGIPYGVSGALVSYLELLLEVVPFPDHFQPGFQISINEETKHLSVLVSVPEPKELEWVTKRHKYVRTQGEIIKYNLAQKEVNGAFRELLIHLLLLVFNEVVCLDKTEWLSKLSVEVVVSGGAGLEVRLVSSTIDRASLKEDWLQGSSFDLIVAALGVKVSTNPIGLVPVREKGIRKL